jgi:hypothetical protein
MNKITTVGLAAAIFLVVGLLSTVPILGEGSRWIFESTIVPCGPSVNCGGFAQNVATMAPVAGRVIVLDSGLVSAELKCQCPNQTFEVHFGSFTTGVFEGQTLGTITTDSNGEFGGSITTSSGGNFVFATGPHSGQFALNVAGIRTEFVTGFNN